MPGLRIEFDVCTFDGGLLSNDDNPFLIPRTPFTEESLGFSLLLFFVLIQNIYVAFYLLL